jgi:hypothetical protein
VPRVTSGGPAGDQQVPVGPEPAAAVFSQAVSAAQAVSVEQLVSVERAVSVEPPTPAEPVTAAEPVTTRVPVVHAAPAPVSAPAPGLAVPVPYGPPMAYPPYGQPGYGAPYPMYWPYPAPRRPSRATRLTVLALTITLGFCVFGVGILTTYAVATGAFAAGPVWQDTVPKDPPPAADAPASAWSDWARRSVDDAVRIQAKALVAGDEEGFESIADPANATLIADLKRRFGVLRAMGLGTWTESLTGGLTQGTGRSWSGDIKISYCFGDKGCVPTQVTESSRWEVHYDQLVMVTLGKSDPQDNGPRPWEVDQLTVVKGKRAIVAATKTNEWRLDSAIVAADQAAQVADQFAKWSPVPNRYVIFLASPSEWTTWYGHDQPGWAAAWAVPVGDTVTEVMVRTEVVQQRGLQTLLTHELTHVTSLAGKRLGASRSWWLVEGIAEYATMLGQQVNTYDGLEQTHDFVRSTWDGKPNVAAPSSKASLDEASARYGVAFLAVRRIAETYGQDKMLQFWGRVVHDGASLEDASAAVLGTPWTSVSADCASYIRKSVG